MMILYLAVEKPNDKATHIKIAVSHRNKAVMLDVDPVFIGEHTIRQAFSLSSKRSGRFKLTDMMRLAPKQFKERCRGVREVVESRAYGDLVWRMIEEACHESEVAIGDGELVIKEG